MAHCGEGQGLVVQAGEEHKGNFRGVDVGLEEGIKAAAVRQAQVQQDQIDLAFVQMLQALGEPGYPLNGNSLSLRAS
jgi:hypothetical protein